MNHVSVMPTEVMEALALRPGEIAVDGTLGLAGHARLMAESVRPGGTLIAFDWDADMLAEARNRLADVADVEVRYVHADYRAIPEHVDAADAVFLDMGLNNAQIEDAERGISFLREGPLDMRMDRSQGETAAEWLNRAKVKDIEDVLLEYGGERWARHIAEVIVDRRPLETTADLVNCVEAAVPKSKRDKRIHPATRSFQAIRIFINGELDDLQDSVERIAGVLRPGGRMAVLAYHSGEDAAVKHAFRELIKDSDFSLPHRKPRYPSEAEVAANPKSRSARLRVLHRNPSA